MNYEKYLVAAGVDDPELRQQALEYPAKCEKDYSRRAPLVLIKFSLISGK